MQLAPLFIIACAKLTIILLLIECLIYNALFNYTEMSYINILINHIFVWAWRRLNELCQYIVMILKYDYIFMSVFKIHIKYHFY